MVPPDLVAYIREQSAAGVSAIDVRAVLLEAGWSEGDVENALHDVAAGMEPLTAGASLHEDVAQVRGLVAHLAHRVQRLEIRLIDTGMLTMPTELPSGEVGHDRVLREPVATGHPGMAFQMLTALGALAALAVFGYYFQTLVSTSEQAPMAFLEVAGLVGLLHLLLAFFMMRRRKVWSAQLAAATGVAFWSVTVWHAYRTYHYMEVSTAAALGVLFLVLLVVMGRWIDRYSESA